ncbi:hypothetical protein VTJ04DRAFT_2515 [Mycothermus thermophilus]|uniref:uncharacterized protein n=1 Tax=Humicola insolens TaxID=85995 RepID=UPI003743C95B
MCFGKPPMLALGLAWYQGDIPTVEQEDNLGPMRRTCVRPHETITGGWSRKLQPAPTMFVLTASAAVSSGTAFSSLSPIAKASRELRTTFLHNARRRFRPQHHERSNERKPRTLMRGIRMTQVNTIRPRSPAVANFAFASSRCVRFALRPVTPFDPAVFWPVTHLLCVYTPFTLYS